MAILIALGSAAISSAGDSAAAIETAQRLRQTGTAILLYAQDHNGEFPRSGHSAFPYRQRGWAREILPYLGQDKNITNPQFETFAAEHYRSPVDRRETGIGFGLNVYFELDPGYDEYPGAPARWRRIVSLPRPAQTVLMAELVETTSVDHVMAHFWEGGGADGIEVAHDRHNGKSHYLFADGHVERLALKEVYDPANDRNLWHPAGDF